MIFGCILLFQPSACQIVNRRDYVHWILYWKYSPTEPHKKTRSKTFTEKSFIRNLTSLCLKVWNKILNFFRHSKFLFIHRFVRKPRMHFCVWAAHILSRSVLIQLCKKSLPSLSTALIINARVIYFTEITTLETLGSEKLFSVSARLYIVYIWRFIRDRRNSVHLFQVQIH